MLDFFVRKILFLVFLIYCEGCGIPFSGKVESLWKTCISEEELSAIQTALKSVEEGDETELSKFFREKLSFSVNEKALSRLEILGKKLEELVEEVKNPSESAELSEDKTNEEELKGESLQGDSGDNGGTGGVAPGGGVGAGGVGVAPAAAGAGSGSGVAEAAAEPEEAAAEPEEAPPTNKTSKKKTAATSSKPHIKKADVLGIVNKSGIDNINTISSDLLRSLAIYFYKRDQITIQGVPIPQKYMKAKSSARNSENRRGKKTPKASTTTEEESDTTNSSAADSSVSAPSSVADGSATSTATSKVTTPAPQTDSSKDDVSNSDTSGSQGGEILEASSKLGLVGIREIRLFA